MKIFMIMRKFLVVIFCFLTFYACETEESGVILQENNSSSKKNFIEGYVPEGKVKTITLPNELKVSVDEAGNYFHEDIVFPKQFIDSISKQGPMTRGAAERDYTLYWTNNIVPYEIAPGFSSFEEDMIMQAISTIENNSCLKFVEASSKDKNLIYFYTSTRKGIYTNMVGRNPYGINKIHLQHLNFTDGDVLHEIMHCLGFYHEHCRSDRDNYLTILFHNMYYDSAIFDQYKKESRRNVININSFDYKSIMLYGSYAASEGGLPTMLKKDGQRVYGQKRSLSAGDIEALNLLYGPKIHLKRSHLYNISTGKEFIKKYSNTIHFLDMNGKEVALKYPRIVFYKTYTKSYDSITNRKDIFYSSPTSFIVGAGVSSVDLGKSTYRYQKNEKGEDSYIEKGYCIMN